MPIKVPTRGRARLEFTDKEWKQLEDMAQIHCTGEEMASIIGVDYDTLNARIREKYECSFSDWYKIHSDGGKMCLRRAQFKKAVKDGNVPMLIWLGKQWLGQTDKIENESGTQINIDADFFSNLKNNNTHNNNDE